MNPTDVYTQVSSDGQKVAVPVTAPSALDWNESSLKFDREHVTIRGGSPMAPIRIGDRVSKKRGYSFIGTVQSVFTKRNGEIRIVVEMDCTGMLHIYSPQDVELTTDELEIHIKHNP